MGWDPQNPAEETQRRLEKLRKWRMYEKGTANIYSQEEQRERGHGQKMGPDHEEGNKELTIQQAKEFSIYPVVVKCE
jgi:hypothetical protein